MAKKLKKKTAVRKPTAKKTAAKKPARKKVQAVPSHYSSVIPGFQVPQAAKALEFLQKVFGAKIRDRYDGPGGALMHAELRIGDTTIMCGDGMNGETHPLSASIYVKNCDQVFEKAVSLGARVKQPLTNQFYGDRSGRVVDPFGNEWIIATHVEDVSKKEMQRRMKEMMSQPQPAAA